MSPVKVKVRGIYATALTLLLSQKFQIVEPSDVIQTRLGIPASAEPAEVNVFDKADRHGIVIEGVRSAAEEVAEYLREAIPWAVFWQAEARKKSDSPLALAAGLLSRFEAEFPKPAKDFLDTVRAKVAPTMPNHHLLKTVDASKVDELEAKVPPEETRHRRTKALGGNSGFPLSSRETCGPLAPQSRRKPDPSERGGGGANPGKAGPSAHF